MQMHTYFKRKKGSMDNLGGSSELIGQPQILSSLRTGLPAQYSLLDLINNFSYLNPHTLSTILY